MFYLADLRLLFKVYFTLYDERCNILHLDVLTRPIEFISESATLCRIGAGLQMLIKKSFGCSKMAIKHVYRTKDFK